MNAADVEALYAALHPLLFRLATRKHRLAPETAEDVIQNAMLSFLHAYDRVHNPRAWIIAAVANGARAAHRSRERDERLVVADNLAVNPSLIEQLAAREILSRLRKPDREILALRYFDGLLIRQIATILGISVDAADRRLRRALQRAARIASRRMRKSVFHPTQNRTGVF